MSYEIDLFGACGVEAARADSEAVRAAGEPRIRVVATSCGRASTSSSAGDELAVAKQSLALQKQRVALSQRLRDAGRGNQTDVTRGVTQVRTLAADIPRFEGRRKVAQYQLAALLARSPADLPKRRCRMRRAAPADSDRRRRRAARRRAPTCAARPRGSVWRLPRCTRRSASVRRRPVGVAADLFSSTTNRWSFGPLISWSFPVNGQRVREAEATRRCARALDGVVLNALRETQSSLATYAADVRARKRCARRMNRHAIPPTKRIASIWPAASRSSPISTRLAR